MKKFLFLCPFLIFLFLATNSFGVNISWTDWASASIGEAGTAAGSITLDGGTNINVGYSGDINFAQLGTGTNYWTEYSPAPYTGNLIVDNAPTASEMIALSRSGITNTITFSQGVENPIMAIVSQGRSGLPVSYDFGSQFSVLSEGNGAWGDGWYELLPGDILKGYELHAAIQFTGTLSSISWEASPVEYWHGITVGVANSAAVPEPATLFLLGSGLVGLVGFGRKKFLKK